MPACYKAAALQKGAKGGHHLWNRGRYTWYVIVTLYCHLFCVLLIPFFDHFMCPLAVAGLGFKYFVTNPSKRFGHPFKKPFCKAFSRDKILGLHIA